MTIDAHNLDRSYCSSCMNVLLCLSPGKVLKEDGLTAVKTSIEEDEKIVEHFHPKKHIHATSCVIWHCFSQKPAWN